MRYVVGLKIPLRLVLAVLSLTLVLSSACGVRAIIVPSGEPVRIRKDVKAAVWVADKDGKEVPAVVVLPAGWWALPDPGE